MGLEDAKNIPKHVLMKSLLSKEPRKCNVTVTRSTQTESKGLVVAPPAAKKQDQESPQKRISQLFVRMNKESWDKSGSSTDCGECCQCNCGKSRNKRQEANMRSGKGQQHQEAAAAGTAGGAASGAASAGTKNKSDGGGSVAVVPKNYVKQQVKKLDSERRFISKFCCSSSNPTYNRDIVNLMECIRAKLTQEAEDKCSDDSSYPYDDGSEWSSSYHCVEDSEPISFPKETRGAMDRLLDKGACTSRHQNYRNLQLMSRTSTEKVPAPPTWPGMATRMDCHSKNLRSKNSDKCV